MLKNLNSLFLIVFLLVSFNISAQIQEMCGSTVQAHEQRMIDDDEYKRRVEIWRKKINPIIEARNSNRNPDCSNGPLMVPVAIHFDTGIVPVGQELCAIDVAIDQIAELNREFAGLDVDAPLINQFTSCFGADILGNACVEFCIGIVDHPPGFGLLNGDYAVTFGQVSFTISGGNFTPVNPAWDEYVNIYVDNLSGGLLGVSNGIPGNFNGDGVMVDNCVFGTGALSCPGVQFTGSAGCFPTVAEGEVLAHELGHYFGLFHIWGDNFHCSGAQDQIADTPTMSSNYSNYTSCSAHTVCSDLPQTCGSEDMYMNFMSYAGNACMYMFTSDQSDVMNATAVTEGFTTISPKCGIPPIANFDPVGSYFLCNTDCINYTDLSTGLPTTWEWEFEVTSGDIILDITSSTIQNPTVCVISGTTGDITTELIVSNSIDTDTITQVLIVAYAPLRTSYADLDNDTYGDPNNVTVDCDIPVGNVFDNQDCDDTDPNINPAATEICDGVDNNCNDLIDEGTTPNTYYADSDNDTFGDINTTTTGCVPPAGFVSDNQDCDDTDPAINPNATEICDGIDNNCDNMIDEGVPMITYYADTDNDTFGDPNNSLDACSLPAGYVTDDQDCDDTDPTINPNAVEICDGIDNNCDNMIDEGIPMITYYADTDDDTFGDPNISLDACSLPTGYVTDNQDCDDTDPAINPNAVEICDGVDNNCDNVIDEGCVLDDCDGDYLVINTITQNTYRAEINIESEALLNNNQTIIYKAGDDIDLISPFEVVLGTEFLADIGPCMPITFDNGDDDLVSINLKDTDELSPEILGYFSAEEELEFRLIDKMGNELFISQIKRNKLLEELRSSTKNLSSGFYMVTVKSEKHKLSQRIIIVE